MNANSPLRNPAPKEVNWQNLEKKAKHKKTRQQNTQIDLGINNNTDKFKQSLGTFRTNVKRRLDTLEVGQFWSNPAVPFMIVFSLLNFFAVISWGALNFSELSPEIQLFYDAVNERWIGQDKFIVVIITPIILLCLFFIQYKLVREIFKSDRRLAIVISWVMTLINLFFLVAITQIYQLNSNL